MATDAERVTKLRGLLQNAFLTKFPKDSGVPIHSVTGYSVVIDCQSEEHARDLHTAIGLIALNM